jgi:hypothetical protein
MCLKPVDTRKALRDLPADALQRERTGLGTRD